MTQLLVDSSGNLARKCNLVTDDGYSTIADQRALGVYRRETINPEEVPSVIGRANTESSQRGSAGENLTEPHAEVTFTPGFHSHRFAATAVKSSAVTRALLRRSGPSPARPVITRGWARTWRERQIISGGRRPRPAAPAYLCN